jgi:hypothetical protein
VILSWLRALLWERKVASHPARSLRLVPETGLRLLNPRRGLRLSLHVLSLHRKIRKSARGSSTDESADVAR